MTENADDGGDATAAHHASVDVPWRRLDRRMIAVDAVQAAASLVLLLATTWLFGDGGGGGGRWTVLAVAASGMLGAAADAYRWAVTHYRVSGELVERRSGVLVRRYRSVRRDRIRSVDVHAKMRHRLGGLRVVKIGAGQQSAAGEAAFDLDAVSVADARALRVLLLRRLPDPAPVDRGAQAGGPAAAPSGSPPDEQVLARLDPRWVIYNVLNVWALVMAVGLLWGGWWLLAAAGVDPADLVSGFVDRDGPGVGWGVAIAVAAITLIGVVGLAVNFFVEYWNFELARVPADDGGTVLRTRHGLLTTREVALDDRRMRGARIDEPLLWRPVGMSDTTVVTTGVDMSALSQPAAILPRGPIGVARRVTAAVLGTDPNPLDAHLNPHPRAALQRRLVRATLASAAIVALLAWLVATGVVSTAAVPLGLLSWPVTAGGAVIAYRALGHTICGPHLVVRSGLANRSTVALERSAVSTVAIRESVLQRRLRLRSVTVATSAGHGAYDAPDMDRDEAVVFAVEAAPGLLEPFLVRRDAMAAAPRGDGPPAAEPAGARGGVPTSASTNRRERR